MDNNLYLYITHIYFYSLDLVGICSYLLVNFWYTRIAANQSSISALLTNRVGDCFLTIGMFAILWSFGNCENMLENLFFIGIVNKNTNNLPNGQVRKKSDKSLNLGSYLAGLIEADGYIGVHNKNSKSKKYRPKIILVFSLADKPLAEKLSILLQAGKVISKPNIGHVLWQIIAKEEVIKIIHLINGYMRTPKIEALHRAICWLNENDNSSIDCLDLDLSPIDSNSWLAGFTDGESGGFYLSIYKRKNTTRLLLQFKLEIKQVYPNNVNWKLIGSAYFTIFSELCEYLKTSLVSRTIHLNNIGFLFIIIAHSPYSQDIIMEYFDKFPLLGKKALDYADWREVRLKIQNKEHLHPMGLEHIKIIQKRFGGNQPRLINSLGCNYNFYMSDLHLGSKRSFSTRKSLINKRLSICTDLVVWGTNLPSLVGIGRHTKQEREMIKLPPFQYSVIIGLLLSDGWLIFPNTTHKNARLGLAQSLDHSDYIWFVFSILSHYCNIFPVYRQRTRNGKVHCNLDLITRSLPCFTELHSLFYVNKVKGIPENIYELLTPVALAHSHNWGWEL